MLGKGQLPEPTVVDDGVKLKPVPQAQVIEEVYIGLGRDCCVSEVGAQCWCLIATLTRLSSLLSSHTFSCRTHVFHLRVAPFCIRVPK